jgi:hypothetical protein
MKLHAFAILGLVLIIVGVVFITFAFAPKPTPPVDVNLDQSGIGTVNGVYFDSIILHNRGSSNVTVVVEIQTLLDTKPRISDPITLCGGCNGNVSIEEVQPPRNQTSDQYAYYTYALLAPQSIRVEYLSTVLQSRATAYFPEVGAAAIILGLFLLIHEASTPEKKQANRASPGKRFRRR